MAFRNWKWKALTDRKAKRVENEIHLAVEDDYWVDVTGMERQFDGKRWRSETTETSAVESTVTDVTASTGLDMSGHVMPVIDSDGSTGYDLGSPTQKWRDLYLSKGSLYIDGQKVIESNNNTIVMTADSDQNLSIKTKGSGDLELSTEMGAIQLKSDVLVTTGKGFNTADSSAISFKSGINVEGETITNVATPVSDTDAANKGYVDDVAGSATATSTDVTQLQSQVTVIEALMSTDIERLTAVNALTQSFGNADDTIETTLLAAIAGKADVDLGNLTVVQNEGPQGPQGLTGARGTDGTDGTDGAPGPLLFSDFTADEKDYLSLKFTDLTQVQKDQLSLTFEELTVANKLALTGNPGPEGARGPRGLDGPQGPAGDVAEQGAPGRAFIYSDFTASELTNLKGNPFFYEDFTPEQLLGLKGPSGNDGSAFKYEHFNTSQLEGLTGPTGPQGVAGEIGAASIGPQGPIGRTPNLSDFTPEEQAALKGATGSKGDQGEMGELPTITGNGGKVLQTNGLNISWGNVDAFPAQNDSVAGQFLATDGTNTHWMPIEETITTVAAAAVADSSSGSSNSTVVTKTMLPGVPYKFPIGFNFGSGSNVHIQEFIPGDTASSSKWDMDLSGDAWDYDVNSMKFTAAGDLQLAGETGGTYVTKAVNGWNHCMYLMSDGSVFGCQNGDARNAAGIPTQTAVDRYATGNAGAYGVDNTETLSYRASDSTAYTLPATPASPRVRKAAFANGGPLPPMKDIIFSKSGNLTMLLSVDGKLFFTGDFYSGRETAEMYTRRDEWGIRTHNYGQMADWYENPQIVDMGSPVARVWTAKTRIIFELENGKYYTNPNNVGGSAWSTQAPGTSDYTYLPYVEMDYITPGSVREFCFSNNYYTSFIWFKDGTTQATGIYLSSGQIGLSSQTVNMGDELDVEWKDAIDIVQVGEGMMALKANGDLYATGRGYWGDTIGQTTLLKLTLIRQNIKKILGYTQKQYDAGFYLEDNNQDVWSAGWSTSYMHNGKNKNQIWQNHGKLGFSSVSCSTGAYYQSHATTGVTQDGRVLVMGNYKSWEITGLAAYGDPVELAFTSAVNPVSDYWYDTLTSYNVGSVTSAATGGEIDTSALDTITAIDITSFVPTGTTVMFSFSFDDRITWSTPMTPTEVGSYDWTTQVVGAVMDVKIDMVANVEDATPRVSNIVVKGTMKGIWAQALVSPDHYLVHHEIDNPSTVVVTAVTNKAPKIVTIDIEE